MYKCIICGNFNCIAVVVMDGRSDSGALVIRLLGTLKRNQLAHLSLKPKNTIPNRSSTHVQQYRVTEVPAGVSSSRDFSQVTE